MIAVLTRQASMAALFIDNTLFEQFRVFTVQFSEKYFHENERDVCRIPSSIICYFINDHELFLSEIETW